MSEWRPISEHPEPDSYDANGKWHGETGPMIDLLMEDGRIVRNAQWRGEPNVKGSVTWAFWSPGDEAGIPLYTPKAWRAALTSQFKGNCEQS